MPSKLPLLFTGAVVLLAASCGGSAGKPASDQDVAVAEADALTLTLNRRGEGFGVDLTCKEFTYGNGPGTYVVFLRESALRKAIRLTGATPGCVSKRSSGTYDTATGKSDVWTNSRSPLPSWRARRKASPPWEWWTWPVH